MVQQHGWGGTVKHKIGSWCEAILRRRFVSRGNRGFYLQESTVVDEIFYERNDRTCRLTREGGLLTLNVLILLIVTTALLVQFDTKGVHTRE